MFHAFEMYVNRFIDLKSHATTSTRTPESVGLILSLIFTKQLN